MTIRHSYNSLVEQAITAGVKELMPWDLEEKLTAGETPLLLDIREPHEFNAAHIAGSLNVPRGVLEAACDYDFDETEAELVTARDQEIIVICRSGNRSVLAAQTLIQLGYNSPISLKTGVRGWNDYEQALVDIDKNPVDIDDADTLLASKLRPEQMSPTD